MGVQRNTGTLVCDHRDQSDESDTTWTFGRIGRLSRLSSIEVEPHVESENPGQRQFACKVECVIRDTVADRNLEEKEKLDTAPSIG